MKRYLGNVPRYSTVVGAQVIQGPLGFVEKYEKGRGN
jgi:hypothetical protein